MRRLPVLLAAVLLACATVDRPTSVETQLFFGFSRAGETVVTKAHWETFLREELTPRFPDGYTVLRAQGHWRGPDGVVIEERSRLVLLVHTPGGAADEKLEAIRAAYRLRFGQDSVLRVTVPASASF